MTFLLSFKELGHYRNYYGQQKQDTTYAYANAKDNAKLGGKESIYIKESHVRRKRFISQTVYTARTTINYKTVPVTNSNKYLPYGTSGIE